MKHALLLLIALALPQTVVAQPVHEILYPDLVGAELREAIARDYYPTSWYTYNRARDTLFTAIYGEPNTSGGDSLRCVYSGYAIELDPALDPTTDAFNQGITTEHTYPQSMGADEEPAQSDMHHLFPVKSNVNSSRSNNPFAEIPDDQVERWFWRELSTEDEPADNLDEYAEKDNDSPYAEYQGRFEPREVHKGNAARAVYYFATIYPDRADQRFFEVQMEDLRRWHYYDLPDSAEYARTQLIAEHQGTANPFVLDTTLIRRAYFEEQNGVSNEEEEFLAFSLSGPSPNPFRSSASLTLTLDRPQTITIEAFDVLGRRVSVLHEGLFGAGPHPVTFNGDGLPAGVYIVRARGEAGIRTSRAIRIN